MAPITTTQPADAARTAPQSLAIGYTTRGRPREALITIDDAGVWCVYDVPSERSKVKTGRLVARLDAAGEKLPQAIYLAAEYVACHVAFAAGLRPEPVYPDPRRRIARVPLKSIRRDASRAMAVALAGEMREAPEWFQQIVALADETRRADGEPITEPLAA
jgi:hypothetical protein